MEIRGRRGLGASPSIVVECVGGSPGRLMRASEYVVSAYFTWTSLLALTLSISTFNRVRALLANLLVLLVYLVLLRLHQAEWVRIARDWIPQGLIVLAYKEMGWFAPASHTNRLEQGWIVWDRLLLDQWQGRACI